MKINRFSNQVLFAGASALVLAHAAPIAKAQDEDTARTLSTVTVTTQKTEESIQDVPIAVSAFDDETLEKLQLAGGRDLVKSIPNVNFTAGNFGGFNFRIRGIGVDSVSTSSDAGVGVHMNDVPLTSNSFFEAEFYDVERVETLRGPQGTLYGRNATGGVVNVITAKPVLEELQADARFTYGSDNTVKTKGMVNFPIGERAALRLAGSYLSRDGFVQNLTTGNDIDDREVFSVRGSLAFEPASNFRTLLMVEHFEADDSRLRSGKQLCATDPIKTSFNGIPIGAFDQIVTSLGCVDAPLNSEASLGGLNNAATLGAQYGFLSGLIGNIDPTTGNLINFSANTSGIPSDLRTVESLFDPTFETEQSLVTWRAGYDLTEDLTLTYLGSFNERTNVSQEDYNEQASDVPFNETAGPLIALNGESAPALATLYSMLFPDGVVSDPQLGASNFYRAGDLSGSVTEQSTHELRLQSNFDGPFNFNLGAIKVDFETIQAPEVQEGYYVFFNTSSAFNTLLNAASGAEVFPIEDAASAGSTPIENIDGVSRQYFRSLTPYTLDSFAVFGEGYYDITDDLQLTVGLRYTSDEKEVRRVPTFLSVNVVEIADPLALAPIPGNSNDEAGDGTYNATFEETTGRIGLDWSPDLSWSDDSLFYAFYSRGYKGGGINPPQPAGAELFPQTFEPEFVDSYEIGTKNTFANGTVQANATAFYYEYEGYQISQIVNRTSANFNVDAEITGFELEMLWNPTSTLLLNANLGLLDAKVVDTFGIDVLDRTNGRDDLVVLKLFPGASNCVVSAEGYATVLGGIAAGILDPGSTLRLCSGAFAGAEAALGVSDVTYVDRNGVTQTIGGLTPFEGEGKNLDGNAMPGTPDSTFNFGAEYTWEGLFDGSFDLRLRGDYYHQADAYSRIWNTPRDVLESWDNVNLSLQLVNTENDWSIEVFGKNITDEEVITGAYLTDDSSGLFTNVFLNEPATYGVTISKSW